MKCPCPCQRHHDLSVSLSLHFPLTHEQDPKTLKLLHLVQRLSLNPERAKAIACKHRKHIICTWLPWLSRILACFIARILFPRKHASKVRMYEMFFPCFMPQYVDFSFSVGAVILRSYSLPKRTNLQYFSPLLISFKDTVTSNHIHFVMSIFGQKCSFLHISTCKSRWKWNLAEGLNCTAYKTSLQASGHGLGRKPI